MLLCVNDGPIPRKSTRFGEVPVMMKPAMPAFSPVCTRRRVDKLIACVTRGVAVGDGVGDAMVGLGDAGGLAVGVAVGAGGVMKGVGVAEGVADGERGGLGVGSVKPLLTVMESESTESHSVWG